MKKNFLNLKNKKERNVIEHDKYKKILQNALI
jgi:hypothetical protein